MKYIKGTTQFQINEPTVISFGKFDGLHRGHELLIEYMLQKRKSGLATVVFTFDIPPVQSDTLDEYKVLTTNEEKMHVFEQTGIDYLIECPVTPEFMHMKPYEFIQMIVKDLNVKAMVMGTDFTFGYQRSGNYHTMEQFADEFGYEVKVVEKKQFRGRDISSTYIREEISKGNVKRANQLLGYHYFVQGKVEHGKHIGGPVLGFPTINLVPSANKLLPPYGVYVTRIFMNGNEYHGISNVGCKPTIDGVHPVGVETNIFDFNQNVYGCDVKVEFLERVRGEHKFDSLDLLKSQMQKDIAFGKEYYQKLDN